eukprot:1119828-Pelagomonas_calceolata.AAC.1
MAGKTVNRKRPPSFVQERKDSWAQLPALDVFEVGEGVSLLIERAWNPDWVKVNAVRMTEIRNTECVFVEQGFGTAFGANRDGVMAVCKDLDRLVADKRQKGLKAMKNARNFSQ